MMRANEFSGKSSVEGPFKVTAFDPQTRKVTLANGASITLSPNIKDQPKPGHNYAFDLSGDVASKLVLLTVDTVITTGTEVLLIKRVNEPFAGYWALPGGFIDPGESPEEAARRELEEEAGLTIGSAMKFVGKFDTPHRDPRMADTWSYAYSLQVPKEQVRAGDDASEAKWIPISALSKLQLAFDHAAIINRALKS